jgi:hypothetical protein
MRLFTILIGILFMAGLIAPPAILANDSVARFGAGGIELIKTEHIRMLEEILEISPKKVRVKYRFVNESDKDIHTTVAFPFPSYHPLSPILAPGADVAQAMPKTFKVLVNGRPMAIKRAGKAIVGGKDITDELRKAGLSEEEIFDDQNEKSILERINKYKAKFGEDWRVSETAFWDMTFPAKQETIIEHEYVPAAGAGYSGWFYRHGESSAEYLKDMEGLWMLSGKYDENEVCLDEKTKRAVENKIKTAVLKGAKTVGLNYDSVEYILGTARNWKGPIAEFKLRIIKEKPDQFVSLCFPGEPQKISPTIYEFSQKDYMPQDRLVVYFYTIDKL